MTKWFCDVCGVDFTPRPHESTGNKFSQGQSLLIEGQKFQVDLQMTVQLYLNGQPATTTLERHADVCEPCRRLLCDRFWAARNGATK